MLFACSKDEIATNENNDDTSENTDSSDESSDNNTIDTADWSLITHSNDIDPNYSEVYDDNNTVRRIDIVFDSLTKTLFLNLLIFITMVFSGIKLVLDLKAILVLHFLGEMVFGKCHLN